MRFLFGLLLTVLALTVSAPVKVDSVTHRLRGSAKISGATLQQQLIQDPEAGAGAAPQPSLSSSSSSSSSSSGATPNEDVSADSYLESQSFSTSFLQSKNRHPAYGYRLLESRAGSLYRESIEVRASQAAELIEMDVNSKGASKSIKSQLEINTGTNLLSTLLMLSSQADSLLANATSASAPTDDGASAGASPTFAPRFVVTNDKNATDLEQDILRLTGANEDDLVAEADAEEKQSVAEIKTTHILTVMFDDFFTSDEIDNGLTDQRIDEFVNQAANLSIGLTADEISKHAKLLRRLLNEYNTILRTSKDDQVYEYSSVKQMIIYVLQSFVSQRNQLKHEILSVEQQVKAFAALLNLLKDDRTKLIVAIHKLSLEKDKEQLKIKLEALLADITLAIAADAHASALLKVERAHLDLLATSNIDEETIKSEFHAHLSDRTAYCGYLRQQKAEKPGLAPEFYPVFDCFCDVDRPFSQCSAQLQLVTNDIMHDLPNYNEDIKALIEDEGNPEFAQMRDELTKRMQAYVEQYEQADADIPREAVIHETFQTPEQRLTKQDLKNSHSRSNGSLAESSSALRKTQLDVDTGMCEFSGSLDILGGSCSAGGECERNPEVCMGLECCFPPALGVICVGGGGCVSNNNFYIYIELKVCVPGSGKLKKIKDKLDKVGLSLCITVAKVSYYPLHGYLVVSAELSLIVGVRVEITIQTHKAIRPLCAGDKKYTEVYCVMNPGDWYLQLSVGIDIVIASWWWVVWEYGQIPIVCPDAPKVVTYDNEANTAVQASSSSEVGVAEVDLNEFDFPSNYFNGFDQEFTFQCPDQQILTGVFSIHSNHHEDRQFKFHCSNVRDYEPVNCFTTGNVNSFDNYMNSDCPAGYVMKGLWSQHSNHHEDRIHRWICCQMKNKHDKGTRSLFNCGENSDWINDWDGCMEAKVRPGSVMVGWESYHDNGKEDRLYKFHYCSIDPGNYENAKRSVSLLNNPYTIFWCSWSCNQQRTTYNSMDGGAYLPPTIYHAQIGALTGVESEHRNSGEDRWFRWRFSRAVNGIEDCYWTGHNQPDANIDFTCSGNRVVAYVQSGYYTRQNDRWYNFLCCRVRGATVGQIVSNAAANNYDGRMDVNYAPAAIVGLVSTHHNGHEDRIFAWRTANLLIA